MDTGQENNEALLNPEPEAPARFPNRHEAGDLLAAVLTAYRDTDALVLGLPRGGVIVAAAVARRLGAELDAVISRKIAVPAQPELAMGAVTADGGVYVNERTVAAHDVSGEQLAAAIARETAEAKARQEQFRGDRPPRIANRTVIVVDDGLATGATMRATLRSVRAEHPARLVTAVPVGDRAACEEFQAEADELVCLSVLGATGAVGSHYDDFDPPDDETVRSLLESFAPPGPDRRED
jgi:putative phosphoribosyl transferase